MTETEKRIQDLERNVAEACTTIREQAATIEALRKEGSGDSWDRVEKLEQDNMLLRMAMREKDEDRAKEREKISNWIGMQEREIQRLRKTVTELKAQLEESQGDLMELLEGIQKVIDREKAT